MTRIRTVEWGTIRCVSYVVEIRDTVVRFMDCIYIYAMKFVK